MSRAMVSRLRRWDFRALSIHTRRNSPLSAWLVTCHKDRLPGPDRVHSLALPSVDRWTLSKCVERINYRSDIWRWLRMKTAVGSISPPSITRRCSELRAEDQIQVQER